MITQHLRPALVMLALFTVLTGLAYPLTIAGIGQLAFPRQASGSLASRNGVIVGSMLIGQNFAAPKYFHGRPSATNAPDPKDVSKTIDAPYNAANSSGSNLGPLSKALVDRVAASIKAEWPNGHAPADAVTTSASGLDPDISPEFARAQVPTVAKARSMTEAALAAFVEAHIQGRLLGLIGEPQVNVLELNLALDTLTQTASAQHGQPGSEPVTSR